MPFFFFLSFNFSCFAFKSNKKIAQILKKFAQPSDLTTSNFKSSAARRGKQFGCHINYIYWILLESENISLFYLHLFTFPSMLAVLSPTLCPSSNLPTIVRTLRTITALSSELAEKLNYCQNCQNCQNYDSTVVRTVRTITALSSELTEKKNYKNC